MPLDHCAAARFARRRGDALMSFPVHPILVNFTAALVPISLVCDVLARLTGRESLRATGWWTLVFATAITPLTVIAGWLWLDDMDGMDMPDMTVHKWLGTFLIGVFAALLAWRWQAHRRNAAPGIAYLATAGLVVAALSLQGHLGGTMSFGGGPIFGAGTETSTEEGPMDSDSREPGHHHGDASETPASTGEPEWRDYIDVSDTP